MTAQPTSPRGRGASSNPPNRFERISLERDIDWDPTEDPAPRTEFLRDQTSTILAHNDSPDLGFDTSINVYRGCEHGCAYCYARPYHEYLGFSAGLDFETKIMVKEDAPELLRKELSSPRWKPRMIGMSGVTDCYQPAERRFRITRRCLEVLAECRNPVAIVTKNFLITRDLDLLKELARYQAVAVFISVTSLDSDLARELEPRTSMPRQRLAAIETLASAGVPVGVLIAPVIPGLTDHEMLPIVAQTAKAGASYAAYTVLRLPYAVKDVFERWITEHAPLKKEKVLNQIRSLRGGELNDSDFGRRMTGEGHLAAQIAKTFEVATRKAGLWGREPVLSANSFRRPAGAQLTLF